jgi:hypothetical protein
VGVAPARGAGPEPDDDRLDLDRLLPLEAVADPPARLVGLVEPLPHRPLLPLGDQQLVEQGLVRGVRLGQAQVRVLRRQVDRFKGHQPLPQRLDGGVDAPDPEDIEGHEPEVAAVAVLDALRVLGTGRQDRDRNLEQVGRDRVAGVDHGRGADQLAVEDRPDQVVEAGRQVRQVGLELAQPKVDLGDGAARDPDTLLGDVEQRPHAIHLLLHAPAGVVPLDGCGLGVVEVVPVPEEHRFDLFREGLARVLLRPEVVAEGVQVRLLGRPPLGRDDDPELAAQGLDFGQGLGHGFDPHVDCRPDRVPAQPEPTSRLTGHAGAAITLTSHSSAGEVRGWAHSR